MGERKCDERDCTKGRKYKCGLAPAPGPRVYDSRGRPVRFLNFATIDDGVCEKCGGTGRLPSPPTERAG